MAIAVLLAAVIASALWFSVANPLIREFAQISRLKSDIRALDSQRLRLGGAERWVQAKADAGALRGILFDGAAPAANIAQLQGMMRTTASGAGLTVISAQPYAPGSLDESKSVAEIGVRMNLSGALSQFTDFLYALSEAKPIVIVDGVELRAAPGASGSETLNATISAVGFTGAATGKS